MDLSIALDEMKNAACVIHCIYNVMAYHAPILAVPGSVNANTLAYMTVMGEAYLPLVEKYKAFQIKHGSDDLAQIIQDDLADYVQTFLPSYFLSGKEQQSLLAVKTADLPVSHDLLQQTEKH